MSLEINIIIMGLITGAVCYGFYLVGSKHIFEKWLEENKDKTND